MRNICWSIRRYLKGENGICDKFNINSLYIGNLFNQTYAYAKQNSDLSGMDKIIEEIQRQAQEYEQKSKQLVQENEKILGYGGNAYY